MTDMERAELWARVAAALAFASVVWAVVAIAWLLWPTPDVPSDNVCVASQSLDADGTATTSPVTCTVSP